MEHRELTWEEGWKTIQSGIIKIKNLLEVHHKAAVASHDMMLIDTATYNMCTQDEKNPERLYNGYH